MNIKVQDYDCVIGLTPIIHSDFDSGLCAPLGTNMTMKNLNQAVRNYCQFRKVISCRWNMKTHPSSGG